MFCYQCEQTMNGTGCTRAGVCGKTGETAALQDALLHATQGVSVYAHAMRALCKKDREIDVAVIEALFTTVTNVNFDPDAVAKMVWKMNGLRERARAIYLAACSEKGTVPVSFGGAATWTPVGDRAAIAAQAEAFSTVELKTRLGEDISSLYSLVVYGLKGMAAYADHAQILGQEDDTVYAFFHEALAYLAGDDLTVDGLLGYAMKCGSVNLRVMELLDLANTGAYGHPAPVKVRVTPLKGKAILVSGHDLKDLHRLLVLTEGKGINVYTHGEMLPANAYPGLNRFSHLAGNYGGAWQDQQKEFAAFPGAVLMTTNCIQRPAESYKGRIFTTGLVEWPGVTHVTADGFDAVVSAALAAPGFDADGPEQFITIGFARNTVLSVAGKVVEGVKSGAIRHFFLVGGCDGAKSGRNYYTEFAQKVPKDCVILTLACGKYRFNKLDFGDIGGIPRLLDVGQCNDAYSAIQIAVALAGAFGTDVNSLPLSMVLSWYEQKAVVILLTLLSLGIKNIRLGPSLPAFISPAVLGVLVEKFGIKPITTPVGDLKAILG
ncbi:MAG: hydroxylamine reductase [Myxococcota bacterium]|jgi:hydroxylamine reductase